jgi:tetratricopeptide (TPR) repeat protein
MLPLRRGVMFIIYGSRFYSRKNVKTRTGVCRHCGRTNKLQSFEGYRFGHLYFIPIIPLGREQAIEMCSSCERYLSVPVDKWKRAAEASISEATSAYNADRTVENGIGLFSAFDLYGTEEQTSGFLKELTQRHDEPPVLSLAAVWHGGRGNTELAQKLAESALQKGSEEDAPRRILMYAAIKRGDLSQALGHALALKEDGFDVNTLTGLASGLRKAGRTREAYQVIQKVIALNPKATSFYPFRKEAKTLEKQLNVVNGVVAPMGQKDRMVLAAFAVAAVLALIGGNFYLERHQSLILTNQFVVPATVKLDDFPPVQLEPKSEKRFDIAEGNHSVVITVGGRTLPPKTIQVENAVHERFFSSPLFVLSTGTNAVIVREEVLYSTKFKELEKARASGAQQEQANEPEPKYELFTGRLLTKLKGIDYPFRDPPKEVSVKNQNETTRIHAYALAVDPYQTLEFLMDHPNMVTQEDILLHMEGAIEAGQADPQYIMLYRALTGKMEKTERAEEFLSRLSTGI